jgi:hypothetical protein
MMGSRGSGGYGGVNGKVEAIMRRDVDEKTPCVRRRRRRHQDAMGRGRACEIVRAGELLVWNGQGWVYAPTNAEVQCRSR